MPCDQAIIDRVLDSDFHDFEDAVQYFSALAAGAEVLVTRDEGHFPASELPVMTPTRFLAEHRRR